MTRRTLFIINPTAGGGRGLQRWAQFADRLLKETPAPAHFFTTEPREAERIASKAAQEYDLLVAVGGDGTVSEIANGILSTENSKTALAIVPCGTGNDFARTAGVPNQEDALQALLHGTLHQVDVIRISCIADGQTVSRYALSFGGVGIIGAVLRNATLGWKRVLGRSMAYRVGLLKALWNYSSPNMRIMTDGKKVEGRFLFLGLNNGEDAGGGLKLAPGARNDDGVLNVNLVGEVGRWEGLKEIRQLSRGTHTAHPKVAYFPARDVSVEAEEALEVAADGDLIGHTPARFEVRPGVLALLTPRRL